LAETAASVRLARNRLSTFAPGHDVDEEGRRLQASVLIADLAVRRPTERLLARTLEAACHYGLLELDLARAHKD
jgi:hypothetical protein